MASAIFLLDSQGRPLLSRNYRGDVPMSAVDEFPRLLVESTSGGSSGVPCITLHGINYLFVEHNNIYLLAVTKNNSNAMSVLLFLSHLVTVFEQYFNDLQEESIRDNFVVIYELLDEMMDFGHPQITDSKILQEYITQESHPSEAYTSVDAAESAVSAVASAISWRPANIYYKKNELFLDVVESVNTTITADGKVLDAEILGKVNVNAYLSGMPTLKLGLNDVALTSSNPNPKRNLSKYVEFEDLKFHTCVELDGFDKSRTISFIPPNGKFELMSYRISKFRSKPLYLVKSNVQVKSHSRVLVSVSATSQYKKRSVAKEVEILIPVPSDADSPRFKASAGSTVVYAPELNCIVWKIREFSGGKQVSMKAELQLSSIDSQQSWQQMPVQVKFEIPYMAVSGLQVRYLKINEPRLKYQSLPWVRYLTESGDYLVKVGSRSTPQ